MAFDCAVQYGGVVDCSLFFGLDGQGGWFVPPLPGAGFRLCLTTPVCPRTHLVEGGQLNELRPLTFSGWGDQTTLSDQSTIQANHQYIGEESLPQIYMPIRHYQGKKRKILEGIGL